MNETHTWRKGEELSLEVTDLNAEGEGIARVGDREVELPSRSRATASARAS